MEIIAIKEFELDLKKLDSILESVLDRYQLDSDYAIMITEATSDIDTLDDMIFEADSKITDKIKKVIDAIIEAFKKMIENLKNEYKKMIIKRDLNKRIEALEKVWINHNKSIKFITGKKANRQMNKEIKVVCKEYSALMQQVVGYTIDIANARTESALNKAIDKLDSWNDVNYNKLLTFNTLLNNVCFSSIQQGLNSVKKEINEINTIFENISNDAYKQMTMIKKAALDIAEDDELRARKITELEAGLKLLSTYYADLSKSVFHHPYIVYEELNKIINGNKSETSEEKTSDNK